MQTIPANELLAGLTLAEPADYPRCCYRQPQGRARLRVRLLPR